ncbi:MAG TPA: glycosyltransferase family 2 protein [Burkholderiaceae bacterium]|nr:glycosyltransferase family 2 protein [Burkholderiaceae bacterium]
MKFQLNGRRSMAVLLASVRVVAAVGLIVPLLFAASVTAWLLACALAILLAGSLVRWGFLLLIDESHFIASTPGLRVAVVTSFVPGAESLPMLERTLAGMQKLCYPHDTWLLDEGDDDAAIELCARLGVRHFSRKAKAEYQTEQGQYQRGTKHGNYNAWLSEIGFANYDVLAAIDPDHVPGSNFLTETLGQLSDPRIAYVQSPQEYYNQPASLIARGCSEESRDFYWISQRAFHRFGSPSVIGAHGVHRMKALQAMGGLAPHIADDLLLTLRYQMSGWRGAYVARVLARGLAPVDWRTYVKQQRRWATSLFDVKFFLYPEMVQGMPFRGRVVGLLQGLTFLQDGVAALCCAMALAALLVAGVPASLASALASPPVLTSATILLLTGLYPHLFHGPHRNLTFHWRAGLLRLVKWPYTLLALADVIRRRDRGYALTAKVGRATADRSFLWPHVIICGLIGATWILAMTLGSIQHLLPHVAAVAAMLPSLFLVGSSFIPAPAAFDPMLADGHADAEL